MKTFHRKVKIKGLFTLEMKILSQTWALVVSKESEVTVADYRRGNANSMQKTGRNRNKHKHSD